MPEIDGTCEYVLDPDDPETWGGEEGDECHVDEQVLNDENVWTCPHEAQEAIDIADDIKSLCYFHLPIEIKDDEEVVDAFADALEEAANSDDPEVRGRKLQFLSATFGEFDLSETHINIPFEEGELMMDYAEIAGRVDWSNTVFDIPSLSLRFVEFGGGDETDFWGTEFGADFRETEFGGGANFQGAEFSGIVGFWKAEFGDVAFFWEAEFRNDVDFGNAELGGEANFYMVEFERRVRFRGAKFGGDANFRGTEFNSDVDFRNAELGGEADFERAEFGGRVRFRGAKFEEKVNFRFQTLEESRFDEADLTDATFSKANLQEASFESALLSRATLFGADLRGAKLSGAVLGDVRIDEDTQFLGHPSDDSDTSPHTFSAIRSRPTCVYDTDYEEDNEHEDVDKAKSVYRALEELAGKAARPRLQARCFVRRQDLQKDEYKRDAKEAESWQERLIAGARWSRSKVSRMVLLYGESPWRIIGWSVAIVLGFALLYPLGGWMEPEGGDPITYSQILSNPLELLNSVYYSTLTFTALGFGDFQPVGLGRMWTTIETGLGAVLLALLVFILGRRAAR